MPPVKQPSAAPTTKVTAATLGAALSQLIVHLAHLDPAIDVSLTIVLTFLLGWLVPERT